MTPTRKYYGGEALVDVLPLGEQATLKHAVKTNKCVISITPVLDQLRAYHQRHRQSTQRRCRAGRTEYES